jgi:hypothetical protein
MQALRRLLCFQVARQCNDVELATSRRTRRLATRSALKSAGSFRDTEDSSRFDSFGIILLSVVGSLLLLFLLARGPLSTGHAANRSYLFRTRCCACRDTEDSSQCSGWIGSERGRSSRFDSLGILLLSVFGALFILLIAVWTLMSCRRRDCLWCVRRHRRTPAMHAQPSANGPSELEDPPGSAQPGHGHAPGAQCFPNPLRLRLRQRRDGGVISGRTSPTPPCAAQHLADVCSCLSFCLCQLP